MTDDTNNKIKEITVGLDTVDPNTEVARVRTQAEYLRDSLTNFVGSQLGEIAKLDRVISKGLSSLEDRLDHDELSADETLSVIGTLSNKKTDLTTALLEPFKPSSTAPSPLLNPPPKEEEQSDMEKGMKNLTPEEHKLVDKLIRTIQAEGTT